MTLHPPVRWTIFLAYHSQASALRKRRQNLQDLMRPRLHNFHITSTTFCYSKQVTRPAQVQGAGDRLHLWMEDVAKSHFKDECILGREDSLAIEQSIVRSSVLFCIPNAYQCSWHRRDMINIC